MLLRSRRPFFLDSSATVACALAALNTHRSRSSGEFPEVSRPVSRADSHTSGWADGTTHLLFAPLELLEKLGEPLYLQNVTEHPEAD